MLQPLKGKKYFPIEDIVEFKANSIYNKILKMLFGKSFPMSLSLEKTKSRYLYFKSIWRFKVNTKYKKTLYFSTTYRF